MISIERIDHLLRFVIYKGERYYIARCLEHDFAVQLLDRSKDVEEISGMIAGNVHIAEEKGEKPFANMGPAPEKYQRMEVSHAFSWGQSMSELERLRDLFDVMGVPFEARKEDNKAGTTALVLGECIFKFNPDGSFHAFREAPFIIHERLPAPESL